MRIVRGIIRVHRRIFAEQTVGTVVRHVGSHGQDIPEIEVFMSVRRLQRAVVRIARRPLHDAGDMVVGKVGNQRQVIVVQLDGKAVLLPHARAQRLGKPVRIHAGYHRLVFLVILL